jgi:hypothetical protein
MTNEIETVTPPADEKRRAALKRIGRYVAVTPPAVALLLAAESKPAKAQGISTK